MTEYIITSEQLERLGIPDMFTEREIVRCKDCLYHQEPQAENGWNSVCVLEYETTRNTVPEGFCAWGERQES